MTNEEASEELKEEFEIFKNCIDKADWENPDEELRKIIEANSMAIEILGQQSCDDCISRKAVLEKAINVPIAKVVTEDKVICRRIVFVEDIEELPSVTPTYDLEEYSTKLWKLAYERGKAESEEEE